MSRRRGTAIDGVLLLDKPAGITSNGALQRVRRLFGAAKAGHTGTLDPMATGLLPIAFGEATKFSQFLLEADKRYIAELCLGVETDTGDAEGRVIARCEPRLEAGRIDAVLAGLRGRIQQIPPMYSALKRAGRPLYELARQGLTVEREARWVTIHVLELVAVAGPSLTLDLRCSKGTYVRTLATDIGREIGCGAHLSGLRRVAIGELDIARAVRLDAIEACEPDRRRQWLGPADSLAAGFPQLQLGEEAARRFLNGQAVALDAAGQGSCYRIYGPKGFIGLGEATQSGMLAPRRLISTAAAGEGAADRAA